MVGVTAMRTGAGDVTVEHEYVGLTLSFDHDLIDGAPAARFAAELSRLIEAGDGLPTPSIQSGRLLRCR
jgi:pyruvate/2-oxoglutarate dehydrogenase complex dihydrolipoamide acyltransferase (E2) component